MRMPDAPDHERARRFCEVTLAAPMNSTPCEHKWVDARNEYIESGEWCSKCNEVRAGNETSA